MAGALAVALVGVLGPRVAAAALAPGDILVADGDIRHVLVVDPKTGDRTGLTQGIVGGPVPVALAFEADGDVLVADDDNGFGGGVGLIRVDPATEAVTTVSANGAPAGGPDFGEPAGVAVEANGDILVTDSNSPAAGVIRVDPATGARTTVSANDAPNFAVRNALALEADGDILTLAFAGADFGVGVIRVDPATGARTLVSANGAPPGQPEFAAPLGLAVEADGNIVVVNNDTQICFFCKDDDPRGSVIRIDPATGKRSTVSDNNHGQSEFQDQLFDPRAVAVVPPAPLQQPMAKADCLQGGWRNHGFATQGDCVAFVGTAGKNESGKNVPTPRT